MTDDELSELAEALDDACREAGSLVATRESAQHQEESCCPFGALIRSHWPFAFVVRDETGIPISIAGGFMQGFDGRKLEEHDRRAFDLGRSFRERVLAGEYQ